MKKHILFFAACTISVIMTGCTSGGPETIGAHGKEEVLSGTRAEGLQLFKVDARTINISASGADGMEIRL